MARPLNPATSRYELRAEPKQIETWQAAAERDGRTLAGWIRWTLDRAAEKSNEAEEKNGQGA